MNVISRAGWAAQSASLPVAHMRLPAQTVFVHHSVTNITDDPAADMRTIERIGLQRFGIISYSFVCHPHNGEILEGSGLRRGAHTKGRNSTAFGICWAGDYTTRIPKVQQINATRRIIWWLKHQGHLAADAPIQGHRDVAGTACPGDKLYAILDDLRVPWVEEEAVPPMYDPPLAAGDGIAAVWQREDTGDVIAAVTSKGDVYCWGCEWEGNVRGKPYWGDRRAARIGPRDDGQDGYMVISTTGERYRLPDGMD